MCFKGIYQQKDHKYIQLILARYQEDILKKKNSLAENTWYPKLCNLKKAYERINKKENPSEADKKNFIITSNEKKYLRAIWGDPREYMVGKLTELKQL